MDLGRNLPKGEVADHDATEFSDVVPQAELGLPESWEGGLKTAKRDIDRKATECGSSIQNVSSPAMLVP